MNDVASYTCPCCGAAERYVETLRAERAEDRRELEEARRVQALWDDVDAQCNRRAVEMLARAEKAEDLVRRWGTVIGTAGFRVALNLLSESATWAIADMGDR
jgi:hypothetical protein